MAARVVAIVNSFNRRELLEKALATLLDALRSVPFSSSVLVFDAGSTDGTVEWLAEFRHNGPPEISMIRASAETGASFAAGVNAACSHAQRTFQDVTHLLLFETDNWISAAQPLIDAMNLLDRVAELAGVGFTVRKHDGSAAGFGSPFPTVGQFLGGPQMTHRLRLDKPHRLPRQQEMGFCWFHCDVVFTSPLLVKLQAWTDSGGFAAEDFPFSDSDVDWAWRLHKRGWRMGVIETDDVVHDNGERLSEWSARRVVSFHRARLRLLQRHANVRPTVLRPLLCARHALEWIGLWLTRRGAGRAESLDKRAVLFRSVWHDYEDQLSRRPIGSNTWQAD